MAACQQSTDIFYRHVSNDSGHSSVGKDDLFQVDCGEAVEEAGVIMRDIPETPPGPRPRSISKQSDREGKHVTLTLREDSGLGNDILCSPQREQGGDIGAQTGVREGEQALRNAISTHVSAGCSESDNSATEEVDFPETPETLAIRKCYPQLNGELTLQLVEMSTELYSKSLIDQPVLSRVIEVNGESTHTKALKVLNAVGTKIYNGSLTSTVTPCIQFEDFIQVLEKFGLQGIAERVRNSYAESVIMIEAQNHPPPTGNHKSDNEKDKSSATMTNNSSKCKQQKITRERSYPVHSPASSLRLKWRKQKKSHSADSDVSSDEGGETDSITRWKQVIQSNVEVVKCKITIQKLEKKLKKQKETITQLRNDNEQLEIKVKNLEVQNNLLLRQPSLLSTGTITDFDYDYPDCPQPPSDNWRGCQYCQTIGNVLCKESSV